MLLSVSLDCVQKHHHIGFVFGDEISVQNNLLTPDLSFAITPSQSQRLRVSSTVHDYMYLLRSVQLFKAENKLCGLVEFGWQVAM